MQADDGVARATGHGDGARGGTGVTPYSPLGRSAVLAHYPVRLWAWQQEYYEGLLREFSLLVHGEQSGTTLESAPVRLLQLAELFTTRFGRTLTAVHGERAAALARGADRVDSTVPLVVGMPELLEQVDSALTGADEVCRQGHLLTLPRPPWLVRLFAWTRHELEVQYAGGRPTPWPGPFDVVGA